MEPPFDKLVPAVDNVLLCNTGVDMEYCVIGIRKTAISKTQVNVDNVYIFHFIHSILQYESGFNRKKQETQS